MPCKHCGNTHVIKGRLICYICRYKQNKLVNPYRLAYDNLKHGAKRRNKHFDLSFEDFKQFCIKSNYINKKGTKKESYHIDRIDETKGYTVDNIQLLTNTDNVRKYIRFVTINEYNKKIFETTRQVVEQDIITEAPF